MVLVVELVEIVLMVDSLTVQMDMVRPTYRQGVAMTQESAFLPFKQSNQSVPIS